MTYSLQGGDWDSGSFDLSPVSPRIVTGGDFVRLFNTLTQDQLLRLTASPGPKSYSNFNGVAWSPDGTRIVASSEQGLTFFESSAETARPMWEALNK